MPVFPQSVVLSSISTYLRAETDPCSKHKGGFDIFCKDRIYTYLIGSRKEDSAAALQMAVTN